MKIITRQLLNENFYYATSFESETLQSKRSYLKTKRRFKFCRKFRLQEITLWFVLLRKSDWFYSFMFFKNIDFEIDFFLVSEIGWKNYHVTDFEMKISLRVSFQVNNLQRVRFWSLKTTTRLTFNWTNNNVAVFELKSHRTPPISNRKVYNASDFELKKSQRFWFCRKLCLRKFESCLVVLRKKDSFCNFMFF